MEVITNERIGEKKRRNKARRTILSIFLVLVLGLLIALPTVILPNLKENIEAETIETPDSINALTPAIISKVKDRAYIDDLRNTPSSKEIVVDGSTFKKQYTPNDKGLLITDDKDNLLLDIKLVSPYTVTGLIASSDTKVSEFYLEDWSNDKINLIDEIGFFNVKDNYKEINKVFRFKYGEEIEECYEESCYSYTNWIPFETLDELPHKNIKISMWTNTILGENIEWVPIINGFEILEWAEWLIGTAVYQGENFPAAAVNNPRQIVTGNSGTKMYIADAVIVREYNLSVSGNVSSAILSTSFNPSQGTGNAWGVFFKTDGTKMYILENTDDKIYQYSLSPSWIISSASYDTKLVPLTGDPRGIFIGDSGEKLYYTTTGTDTVHELNCSSAWDISTCSASDTLDVSLEIVNIRSVWFKDDGSKMYILDLNVGDVTEYNLSINWLIDTAVPSTTFSVTSQETSPGGMSFNDAGTKMYVAGEAGDDVNQYWMEPLGTPSKTIDVTLLNPTDGQKIINTTIFFNATLTPTNLNITNATLYVWDSSNVEIIKNDTDLNGGIELVVNWTRSGFLLGEDYHWNVLAGANNTKVFWADDNFTFTASALTEVVQVYNKSVLETTSQFFSQQINAISTVTSAAVEFWYNGSVHNAEATDLTGGVFNVSNVIDIPLSQVYSNKTFYWTWIFTTLTQTLKQNSTIFSHEVNRTNLVNCNSGQSNQTINFTTHNATNPFPIVNATFKIALNHWLGSGNTRRNYSFEDVTETVSNFSFCISHNKTFHTDAVIEYDGIGSALNFYFLTNASLSNKSQTIPLYLLDNSKATLTELKTVDSARNPVEGITIQIQSYDIGTDTFYTVAMAKTSEGGADLTYLNWYDTLYKFIFTQGGEVVKTTSPYKISATPQIFGIISGTVFEFAKFEDMVYNLYYNSTTQNFVYTFTKPSGEVKSSCLRVIKRNITEDTTICLTCETSTSATLYCNVASHGNGTFIASIYGTGSMQWLDILIQAIGETTNRLFKEIGNIDGTVMAIIFSGVVLSFFLFSPAMGIIGMIFGMIGAIVLGFQPGDYAAMSSVIVVGGIIIWLIQK